MKIYNGGSDKDENIFSATGNSAPEPVTALGNQIFIIFITDGDGDGYGFTAKIVFGIRIDR